MKINKAFADQMLLIYGQNYAATTLTQTSGVIFSLWSGAELSQTEMNVIRDTFTDANGIIAGNWPATLMGPNGRVELARLYVPTFSQRSDNSEPNALRKKFELSKITSLMTILAAGNAGSFTLSITGSSWTGWTSAAANSSRVIYNGSVGNLESNADIKFPTTSIALDSKIKPTDINFQFNFPSLEMIW
jgi:hypothetical protein